MKYLIRFSFVLLWVMVITITSSSVLSNITGKNRKPVTDHYTENINSPYTLNDYASWIDFDKGRWFTIFHLSLTQPPWADILDKMANSAFRYLVSGDKADRDFFIEKQMELANSSFNDIFLGTNFEGGNMAHPHGDRVAQDLAEVYIAMRHTMTPEQRSKVEKWYHDFATYVWDNPRYARRQGTVGGFVAVVGYMTGDEDMLKKAKEFLSFEDTWTLQEDARHYAGLIMERMFRIEIFTNNRSFPQSSKANLAKLMRWIISTFPHNGFNPAFGDCWIQNEIDHFMECLMMGSFFLKDYDIILAGECKWLAERMFEYGKKHFTYSDTKDQKEIKFSVYDEKNLESSVYKMQMNPIHLYWYLDESIVPQKPDINFYGSKVNYRLRAHRDIWDRDTALVNFTYMMDKIIHRDSWNEDALYIMLDPVLRSSKNYEGGAGNAIISISYGNEEFITGKILNRFNHEYTQHSVSDIPPDPRRNFNAFLECFTDNPEFSQSVTTLEGWSRTVTLFKTGDRRIVIEDYLPREGNVYWHLQGVPSREKDKITMDVRGTKLEVSYSGHDKVSYQENDTWNDPDLQKRWGYTGNPDHQVKLSRSSEGTIITTFRPLPSK